MKSKLLFVFLIVACPFSSFSQIKKVNINGVEMHYRDTGKGEPVVFVHGVLEDYRIWEAQLARFSKSYRVISYSRRYNYPNHNTAPLRNFSAVSEAADLYHLVQKLKLGRFHLVGHSFGGLTSLFFAKSHPALLLSLTLSEPALLGWIPKTNQLYTEFFDGLLKTVKRHFHNNDTSGILRSTLVYFAGADILDQLPPEAVEAFKQNLPEWKAVANSTNAFPAVTKQFVSNLKVPVLLVFAGQTLPILQVTNKNLEQLLPKAQKVVLPDATHDLWMTHPTETGQGVLAFLDGLKR